MGRMVYECDGYQMALDLATEQCESSLPRAERAKVAFRAAYALECAFLIAPERFTPYLNAFLKAFPTVKNRSVHRHFGKIMAILLQTKRLIPMPEQASLIAETAALWLSDPKSRVAVKVWALEIIKLLAPQVTWVAEIFPDAIGMLSIDPTPAMTVRLKRLRT